MKNVLCEDCGCIISEEDVSIKLETLMHQMISISDEIARINCINALSKEKFMEIFSEIYEKVKDEMEIENI
jgi:anaerobic ribonucleoside-triphosphate reductase